MFLYWKLINDLNMTTGKIQWDDFVTGPVTALLTVGENTVLAGIDEDWFLVITFNLIY